MKTIHAVTLIVFVSCCARLSSADTVTFPDGSTMDGTVKEVNANCFDLIVNGTSIRLQREEVASLEKNGKVGAPGKAAVLPMVERWERDMDEQTGMNAEQRERAVVLIGALVRAKEPKERQRITNELEALNKEVNLVRFFKAGYEDLPVSLKMERLAGLLALAPKAAMPLLKEGLLIPYGPMRALCLVNYCNIEEEAGAFSADAIGCFARGVLDPDPDVQSAAVYALSKAKDKAVTPVLLKAVHSSDLGIATVADMALVALWGAQSPELPKEKPAFWDTHWRINGPKVKNPIDIEKLTPFVTEDAPTLVAHH